MKTSLCCPEQLLAFNRSDIILQLVSASSYFIFLFHYDQKNKNMAWPRGKCSNITDPRKRGGWLPQDESSLQMLIKHIQKCSSAQPIAHDGPMGIKHPHTPLLGPSWKPISSCRPAKLPPWCQKSPEGGSQRYILRVQVRVVQLKSVDICS